MVAKSPIYPTHKAIITVTTDKEEHAGIEEVNPKIVSILKNQQIKYSQRRLEVIKGSTLDGVRDTLIIKLSFRKGVNDLHFLVTPNKRWFGALVKQKEVIIYYDKKSITVISGINTDKLVSDLAKIPNQGLGI